MREWLLVAAIGLLSTGAGAQTTRAMGVPLLDGALPPGVLIVRVVEGEFVRNVVGQDVEVRSLTGGVDRARTEADGRARFERLPPLARVQVFATVAGEVLASEVFEVPAASGARLLLTAGAGTAAGSAAPVSAGPVAGGGAQTSDDRTVWFIARILGTLTILAFAIILWPRLRASGGTAAKRATPADRG